MTQFYIQDRDPKQYQSRINTLLTEGGRIVATGVNLEKAQYWYNGATCKSIEYTNVYWAVIEFNVRATDLTLNV